MAMKDILVLIPAYNEENNLGEVLNSVKELYPGMDILVVNDYSEDNTAEVAEKYGVTVLNHPFKMGYGVALQTGYKFALKEDYDALIQMDGDGQHDPDSIKDLLQSLDKEEVDVVIGSRFLDKDSYRMKPVRRFGARIFSTIATLAIGVKITDPTSGFQALSRRALEFGILDYYPADYPDVDTLILMDQAGLNIKEIPVRMYEDADSQPMHRGMSIFYYMIKMITSVFALICIKILYPGGKKK